jgi:hypothetical protein
VGRHILGGSLTVLKRSNASATKDELRRPTEDVIDQRPQWKEACERPSISSKNDGRLLLQRAAEGKRGEEALQVIGDAYIDEMLSDPIRLLGQMHVYVARSDPEIREVGRIGYGDLVACAERVSGLSPERISSFLATGMLLSVLALMQAQDGAEHWAAMLFKDC